MKNEITICPFSPEYENQVKELILSIQRNEFHIPISAEDQPDLSIIPDFYQRNSGNFWIALSLGKVVGTVGSLDIGNQQIALRKMFVHQDFRGKERAVAQKLLSTLIEFSQTSGVREIVLGTTENFKAAHRFYEKHGFRILHQEELPENFPLMKVDKLFYKRMIGDSK